MKKEEEKLIEKIIKLTENTVDYSSWLSVMKNNRDAKKLFKICELLTTDIQKAENIYGRLLEHYNGNVRRIAASHCLKLNIYTKKSEQVLEECIKEEENKVAKMEAERVLEYW